MSCPNCTCSDCRIKELVAAHDSLMEQRAKLSDENRKLRNEVERLQGEIRRLDTLITETSNPTVEVRHKISGVDFIYPTERVIWTAPGHLTVWSKP